MTTIETTEAAPSDEASESPASVGLAEDALQRTLTAMAGPQARPRPGQLEAVETLLNRRGRVLVVQPTGFGKSAIYWAATRALRSQGEGPTVVISPLLALMRDQIEAAQAAGVRAVTVNSANYDDWQAVFEQLRADSVDALLVSPERLANPRFADQALPLLRRAGMLVIDEAHCVSDWGSDFRPDYQRISALLLHMAPDAPVLATTATANERVTKDVASQLGAGTLVQRGRLARRSLRLSVVPGLDPLQRYAWLDEALADLPGSGIVYAPTVDVAHPLAEFLRGQGHAVAAYTGQTDPERRLELERQLKHNELKALVATSALGMGYDKPDLGFTVHVGSPATPVAYYQQAGRAGRALESAEAVLLPAAESDERLWDYFASATIPDPALVDAVLAALAEGPLSLVELESATGARRGRLEFALKQLRVDGAVDKDGSAWLSTGVAWSYPHDKYESLLATRAAEADQMRHYCAADSCLMSILVNALDDPDPTPCGRCTGCTGHQPSPGSVVDPDRVAAAAKVLRSRPRELLPRRRWPKGVTRSGAITSALQPGRAVAFAADPGWPSLLQTLGSDRIDEELVSSAINETLAAWRPAAPDAIVFVPDGRGHAAAWQPIMATLSDRYRIPALGGFTWTGTPPPDAAASSTHVSHVEASLTWERPEPLPQRVLLVTPSARTRWTITVAAQLLADSGAGEVHPLVVHLLP